MTKIELEIDPNFENVDSNIVKGLITSVMRSEKIEEYEILMIFTDDDTLFKLKKEFFNKEHLHNIFVKIYTIYFYWQNFLAIIIINNQNRFFKTRLAIVIYPFYFN